MTLSQVLLLLQSQWVKDSARYSAEPKTGISPVQFSCKNVSCEQIYTFKSDIPAL
jgi:hypothetical protein